MERRDAEDGKAGEGIAMRWMDATGKEARLNRIWISFNATKAAQKKNDAKSATDRRTYEEMAAGAISAYHLLARVTKVSLPAPDIGRGGANL